MVELNNQEKEKLRQDLLIIMDEIHFLCINNDIHYSLFYGSLIGAVKYKGFIPWDDDIDIVMMKDDYEKFLNVFLNNPPKNLFLQSIDTEKKYKVPGITKVRLNNTLLIENIDKKEKIHHGVWVDLTVIQNIDDNLSTLRKTKYYFSLFRSKYYYKSSLKYLSFKGLIANTIKKIIPPFTLKRTAKKFLKYSQMCDDNNSKYVFQPFSYEDDVYKREWMKEYTLYDFEGRKYLGFKNYEDILMVRFPYYKEIPNKSGQKTNHTFYEVKL